MLEIDTNRFDARGVCINLPRVWIDGSIVAARAFTAFRCNILINGEYIECSIRYGTKRFFDETIEKKQQIDKPFS